MTAVGAVFLLIGLVSSTIAFNDIRAYGLANTRLKFVLTSWALTIVGLVLIFVDFYR
jgi:hypothetical protein